MSNNGHDPAALVGLGCAAMAPLESRLARFARLAARVCDVPAASIELVHGPEPRLGAAHGLEAIAPPAAVEFLASVPLLAADGSLLGTISVMDAKARAGLDPGRMADLRDLAALAAEDVTSARTSPPIAMARSVEEQRNLLDAAFGLARIGTWRRWVGSGKLELSDGAYRLCGMEPGGPALSREEFYGFVHPDDRAALEAAVAAAVTRKGAYEAEFRFLGRDAQTRHCLVHGYCTLDAAGEVESVFAIGRDVTDAKAAEHVLRQKAEETALAYRLAGLSTWRRWFKSGRIDITEGAARLLGLAPGEPPTVDRLFSRVHPEDRAAYMQLVAETLARRGQYETEIRLVTEDQGIRRVMIHAYCTLDANGEPESMLGIAQDVTAQRQVAQELQERREELTRALGVARLGTYRRRLATGEIETSDEMHTILGLRPGERALIRDDVLRTIHPEDRARWYIQAEERLATRTNYEIEVRLAGYDGVTRDCEVRVYYDVDQNDTVTSICALMLDITARKAAELALRERTEDLANALRATRLGTYRRRLATNEVEVSAELYPILGARPGDITPSRETLMKFVHRDDRARWIELAERNLATKTRYETELRLVGFDGKTRYCQVQGYHDFDTNGEVTAVCAVWQDVSERRAAEHALEQSRRDAEDAMHIAGLGVSRLWVKTGELWLSDEVHALVGAKPGEIPQLSGSLRSMIHPQDQERADRLTTQALATGAGGEAEVRVIGVDGRTRHCLVKTRCEFDADGEALSVKAIWQDITERTLAEQTLRRSERLSVIGQLTGGVAHDFNNLLTVIALNLELAANDLGVEDARYRRVNAALEAAQRGAELNRQLLAFAGRQPLRPVTLDVAEFLAPVRTMAERTVGERYTVEFQPGAPGQRCSVDRAQLESALLNLILNARDAMPDGGRIGIATSRVRIDAAQAALYPDGIAGDFVMVAVSDEGSGMPRSVIDRAFEPFFTTKDIGKGTGLGLSMVMGFVRQSGGFVTIDSDVGRGTSVRLYLPATDQAPASTGEREAPAWLPGPVRTLIVEDQTDVREVVSQLCHSIGLDAVVVASAAAALDELARDDGYELLFTDILMPGAMTGTDLAEAALRLHPDLKVLYTSGYSEQGMLIKERLGSTAEFLPKPYRRGELLAALERIFSR